MAQVWEEERPRLLSLPAHAFVADLVRPLPKARGLYVPFDLNHYSIAPRAVGRPLSLVASDIVVRMTRATFVLIPEQDGRYPAHDVGSVGWP